MKHTCITYLRGATNKISLASHTREQAKVTTGAWKSVFSFLRKMSIVSEDLLAIGIDSQLLVQQQRKHVCQYLAVLGTKNCLEMDDHCSKNYQMQTGNHDE